MEKDDGSIDYTAIINQVKDSLERDIQDINDRLDGMNGESDLADRVQMLETEVVTLNDTTDELKNSQEATNQKVEELNETSDTHTEQIKDILERLKDKVDGDTFDREIQELKTLIANLASGDKEVSLEINQNPGDDKLKS